MATTTKNIGKVTVTANGIWNANTNYPILAIVTHNGGAYLSIQKNRGIEPTVTGTWQSYWQTLVQPSVFTVSGTNTLAPGSNASVSITQTGGNVGMTFGIPKGKGFAPLGFYATLAELQSAVTSPNVGDIYGVGTSPNYVYYAWDGTTWVNIGTIGQISGAVRYDIDQTLSAEEKARVQQNIGVGQITGVVRYDEVMSLSAADKDRARGNIDAVSTNTDSGTIVFESILADNASVCRKQGKVVSVILNGTCGNIASAATVKLCTLPTGFRPSAELEVYGQIGQQRSGFFTINTSGEVHFVNKSGSAATGAIKPLFCFITEA